MDRVSLFIKLVLNEWIRVTTVQIYGLTKGRSFSYRRGLELYNDCYIWISVWSWKMSRTNTLTQTANTAINQVINTVQVLNNRYYQTIDRSDAGCFYFPMPGTEAVVFRGQCDQSIAVVQNFDAVRVNIWNNKYSTFFMYDQTLISISLRNKIVIKK